MNEHDSLGRPRILSMAMTSRCNLRCVMCDHGIRNVEKQDFDESLFENIGDFIDTASVVDLTGLGEPLLSSLFWKILDNYPAHEGAPDDAFVLSFNTNGTLLNEKNIDRILAARVKKIRISIDAADEETFYKIRGTSLTPIVGGLRRLIEKRNALGRFRPRIGIEMTVMRETILKVEEMVDLCKEICADFLEVWSLNALPEHMAKDWIVEKNGWTFSYTDQSSSRIPSAELSELVDEWHAYAESRDVPIASMVNGASRGSEGFHEAAGTVTYKSSVVPNWSENSIKCPMPWNELRVLYEGGVRACCWQPGSIGDVSTDTLGAVWNGEPMRELRHDLLEGKIPRTCSGAACPYVGGQVRPADPAPEPEPVIEIGSGREDLVENSRGELARFV